MRKTLERATIRVHGTRSPRSKPDRAGATLGTRQNYECNIPTHSLREPLLRRSMAGKEHRECLYCHRNAPESLALRQAENIVDLPAIWYHESGSS